MTEPLEPMRPVSVGEDVPPDRRMQLLDAALYLCGIAFACFVLFSGVSTALRWTIVIAALIIVLTLHSIALRRSNRVH